MQQARCIQVLHRPKPIRKLLAPSPPHSNPSHFFRAAILTGEGDELNFHQPPSSARLSGPTSAVEQSLNEAATDDSMARLRELALVEKELLGRSHSVSSMAAPFGLQSEWQLESSACYNAEANTSTAILRKSCPELSRIEGVPKRPLNAMARDRHFLNDDCSWTQAYDGPKPVYCDASY